MSEGQTVSAIADGADRIDAGILEYRSAPVLVSAMRYDLRGFPPFAPAYRRITHGLVAFAQALSQVMTIADTATLLRLDWDTVKDLVKERLEVKFGRPDLRSLRRLSIDEIYVGRKGRFYTLVIDLESGRIVWVAPGRSSESLAPFWRQLRLSKAKIEAVCCDLSAAYWKSVRENLPQAAVVFDRFHLVKLMNEKLDLLRREMWREATGPMKANVKGTRYLLLTRRDQLAEDQLPRLDDALRANQPLFIGYLLKEMLGLLWTQRNRVAMENFLRYWCLTAAQTGIRSLQSIAKTFASHSTGILSWWEYPINNSRMEGINNKVKTLLRRHYGLRDERFLQLRLLGLHEAKFSLSGC